MSKPDFTTPDGALAFLSSFWSSSFPERGFVQGLSRNYAQQTDQAHQDAIETINAAGVTTTPLLGRELTLPLTLLESEMSVGPLPIRYGRGVVYGDQPANSLYREGEIFEYGGSEKFAVFYYWALPDGIESLGSVITEKLLEPETLLAVDRDFITIEDRIVAFKENPFETGSFPIREKGEDREIIAWNTEAHTEKNYLHRRWGFPFFSAEKSSEALREFIKTTFALYTGGPSRLMLDAFIAAMARQPVIAEPEETIQEVEEFQGNQVIVTDKSVYTVAVGTPLRDWTVPGRTLDRGSPLTKVTQVDDIISDPKWWETEGGLTLDRGLQHPEYFGGPIYFPNSDETASRFATESCRFQVYGSDEAVAKFWEKVDQGSPDGKFLGTELWKKRGITDTNGDADLSSPLLMNPMGFLIEDIFGVSMIGIRVMGDLLPDAQEFLENLKNLRRGTTPVAALVFFIDYQLSDEYDSPADADGLSLAHGLGVYEDSIELDGVEQILNIKQSISC